MTVPQGRWNAAGRRDSYTFAKVDPLTLEEAGGELDVPYGESSVSCDYDSDVRMTASVVTYDAPDLTHLIRIHHRAELPDGTAADEVLGTFFIGDYDADSSVGRTKYTYDCSSTLLRFTGDEALFGARYETGDRGIAVAADIVHDRFGLIKGWYNADKKLVEPVEWSAGTSVGTCLHSLAAASDLRIAVDDYGYVVFGSLAAYETAATAYAFERDSNCAYAPSFAQRGALADVCNRVKMWYSVSGQSGYSGWSMATRAGAQTLAPQRIGRYISHVEEVDAPGSRTRTYKPDDYLYEHDVAETYEIEHAGVPGLRCGDAVTYSNPSDGAKAVSRRCYVAQMSIELGAWCRTKTKLVAI